MFLDESSICGYRYVEKSSVMKVNNLHSQNDGFLVRSLKSSLPEQYIGFYLYKAFGNEVEYQKQFDWQNKHFRRWEKRKLRF